mgnify:CR=1 FL=1
MAVDKNKALETALTQIEKQFGKGAVMRLGENKHMNIEHISTGSLSLDIALGIGGLPRGRIVEIYGPESSGKTTLAIHAIAEAQTSSTSETAAMLHLLMLSMHLIRHMRQLSVLMLIHSSFHNPTRVKTLLKLQRHLSEAVRLMLS